MVRPRKSELRERQLNLRLTAAEYESIVQRAKSLGMRPVYFGRAMLLDEGKRVADSNERSNICRLVHNQLSRLGNNLNQLVRHLHQTGDPLPPDLDPLLTDIRQVIARLGS